MYDINNNIIEENKQLKEQINSNNKCDFTKEDNELLKFKLEK